MKAVRFAAYGGPEVLEYCDVDRPRPGPGEVLIEVQAIGVNPADHKFRAGALSGHRPKELPLIPGMDVCGWVALIGDGVTRFSVGDEVFGMLPPARLGAYAEIVAGSAGFFSPVPGKLHPHVAAVLPTSGLTGVEMVDDDLNVSAGDKLLVIGALGSVGRAAILAAKRRGAIVTAAVRTGRAGEIRSVDVIETGKPCGAVFDAICDTVGGDAAATYYPNLRPGGVLCSVATTSLPPPTRKDIIVRNFVCYPDVQKLSDLAAAAMTGFVISGAIETLPLSQAAAAHERLEGGERAKFVLLP
jgi:NADPH:quinone reductase-like Zn-dependent oxidoreductase